MHTDSHTTRRPLSPLAKAWLTVLSGALLCVAALPVLAEGLGLQPTSMSDALNRADAVAVAEHVAYVAALMSVRYAVVGLIVGLAVGVVIRRGLVALPVGVAVWAAVTFAGAMLHRVDVLAWPGADALALAMVCAAVGHVVGWGLMLRGWRRWAAIAVMFVALLLVGGWAVSVGGRMIESAPAAVDMAPITRADKKRLIDVAQRPIDEDQHGIAEVTYQPDDLQRLGAWACDISPGNQAIDIELTNDGAIVAGRLDLPGRGRYLNLVSMQRVSVTAGKAKLDWQSLSLGQWKVPGPLLYLATPVLRSLVIDEPGNRQIIAAVDTFALSPGGLTIRYDADRMADVLRSRLAGGAHIDVFDETRLYIDHLLSRADQWPPPHKRRLEAILNDAFALAQQRTAAGGDPVRENRAAIYALATTIGHPDLVRFTGPTIDRLRWPDVSRLVMRPWLRGRRDWTQHFMLSAGITLLSDEGFSDAVGLLKEEVDVGAGGSGFSFADLAADRAGTRFAQVATRDAASAVRIQALLTDRRLDLGVLLPDVADLPEGLREAQLNARYDGIDGPRFKQVVAEIERRLDTCAALK